MRRTSVPAVALAFVAGACGSGGGAPTMPPANTTTTVALVAQLLPSNVVPPVTGGESFGSGNVTITLNVTKNAAGNTVSATADFNATFTGFGFDSLYTGAHVHRGTAAQQVQCPCVIAVDAATIAAPGVLFPTGSGALVRSGVAVDPATADSLALDPAAYFYDIHTASNSNGVLRGQLAKR